MKTPHVHAALIKQWADGAQIQYLSEKGWWLDAYGAPSWRETTAYRVKPEPKPDVVKYWKFTSISHKLCPAFCHDDANVMMVWDGETEQLKSVQMIAHV